ncbi:ATP-binding protein [Streptomyces mashuensis]|uniref:ATP-binding protein n=1 Tax=Streptomyces mashuensis TaxID=33904 RepID=A0A919EG20_9ACTN|nr:ATP-binding protein [Streptomyces mashuensis]GHF67788.1 ATP-binding protein [Streptomyces mashuensis]
MTTTLKSLLHSSHHDWGVALGLSTSHFAAVRFGADPQSPARTRRFLHRTLREWELDRYVEVATAVSAELVANAIQHALRDGGPPGEACPPRAWLALIGKEHGLVCAVADPSPVPPVCAAPRDLAESGRGLHIVAALSETWGFSPPSRQAGKTVWARLAAHLVPL